VFGRDHAFLPRQELLSVEEISRSARLLASVGVCVRRDIEHLVEMLVTWPACMPGRVRSVGRRRRGRWWVDVGVFEQRVLFPTDLARLPPGGKFPSYVGVILRSSRVGDSHDFAVLRLVPGRPGAGEVVRGIVESQRGP
jgi:hypothetical protein